MSRITSAQDSITAGSDAINSVADQLGELPAVADLTGGFLSKRLSMIRSLSKDIDIPILGGLAEDTISLLASWFEDPEVLCCLIQGLWAVYATSNEDNLKKLEDIKNYKIEDSSFAKFIDSLIVFVDLIIALLTSDIKKLSFMIPDFLKEITNGVLSAILLVISETIYALRYSAISGVIKWIDSWVDDDKKNIWSNCLPLADLLNILKKYVHDYGLIAKLEEKIRGFVSGIGAEWKSEALQLKNIKDLEFLYWFRDLLLKLKLAVLNFDLCIDYGTKPPLSNNDDITDNILNLTQSIDSDPDIKDILKGPPSDDPARQGYTIGSNGTILVDSNAVPPLANSSIADFLVKYYGYPTEVANNILTGANSNDNIQGTQINPGGGQRGSDSNFNADCPNTPSPADIMKWASNIRNRES